MNLVRTIGQVQRVTRVESPGCLAIGKTISPCTTTTLNITPREQDICAAAVLKPQVQRVRKSDGVMPWLASGPAALTNDPLVLFNQWRP